MQNFTQDWGCEPCSRGDRTKCGCLSADPTAPCDCFKFCCAQCLNNSSPLPGHICIPPDNKTMGMLRWRQDHPEGIPPGYRDEYPESLSVTCGVRGDVPFVAINGQEELTLTNLFTMAGADSDGVTCDMPLTTVLYEGGGGNMMFLQYGEAQTRLNRPYFDPKGVDSAEVVKNLYAVILAARLLKCGADRTSTATLDLSGGQQHPGL